MATYASRLSSTSMLEGKTNLFIEAVKKHQGLLKALRLVNGTHMHVAGVVCKVLNYIFSLPISAAAFLVKVKANTLFIGTLTCKSRLTLWTRVGVFPGPKTATRTIKAESEGASTA
jgi:hypothetical protein